LEDQESCLGGILTLPAQEIRRIPSMAELYAKGRPDQWEDAASKITLNMLERFSLERPKLGRDAALWQSRPRDKEMKRLHY
jgi:hypothetical protein